MHIVAVTVHEYAQGFEERGHTLDFVDDHEATQAAEGLLGRGEALPVNCGFQIEKGAPRGFGSDLSGQCCLATLAGACQGGAGMDREGFADASGGCRSVEEHESW